MKNATCILAVVVAAFVVGCQNNNITNPTTETPSRSKPAPKIPAARTIRLDAILREPGQFNSFTQIVGQVSYTTTTSQRDPVPPLPQSALVLSLSLSADLSPFGTEKPLWSIAGSSRDELAIDDSKDSPYSPEKTYKIEGRSDGMSLHVNFKISEKNVAVTGMSLQLPKAEYQKDAN